MLVETTGLTADQLDILINQLEEERCLKTKNERMALKCMGLTACPKCQGNIKRIDHIGVVSVWCQNKDCKHWWDEAGYFDAPKLGW